LAELAHIAEEAGWDGIFIEDYITWQGHDDVATYDPWVVLAAMAMRTERVLLGTSVTPVTRRRPWKVAREAASLDHLSGGRCILGVGLGDLGDPGFGKVGEATELRMRARMLDEALDIITGLWSGEPFSYHGTYYHLDEMTFLPPPVQRPRIPIWVGGNWPHAGVIRRAARWDGFMGGKEHAEDEEWFLTPDEIRRVIADIGAQRESSTPCEISLGGNERDADNPEATRALMRASAGAGATWWSEYVHPGIGGLAVMRERIAGGPLHIG
jgi:alkanesulfonate monooxygenase SsuD/methylene tetrahydromethanopterin reductase-like flavin-dependent oxidoreductase (luciferase family)